MGIEHRDAQADSPSATPPDPPPETPLDRQLAARDASTVGRPGAEGTSPDRSDQAADVVREGASPPSGSLTEQIRSRDAAGGIPEAPSPSQRDRERIPVDGGAVPEREVPIEQRAQQIAAGHAYDKHVVTKGEFPEVASRDEFASHIIEVMEKPTDTRDLGRDRTAYYSDPHGTVVIEDPQHVDGGTCLRPRDGRAYYDGLV